MTKHRADLRRISLHLISVVALAIIAACFSDTSIHETANVESEESKPADQSSTSSITAGLRASYIASVQLHAGPAYRFNSVGSARNSAQGFRTELTDGSLLIRSNELAPWHLEMRWTGVGRGDTVKAVANASELEIDGNRATYHRANGSDEWYVNGPLGVEQGFVLTERPPGIDGTLVIELAVGGGLRPSVSSDGRCISLLTPDGEPLLRYTDLYATDRDGLRLDASMTAHDDTIRLIVRDERAQYPIAIDPIVWAQQEKLLPSDGAAGDIFGYGIAMSGSTAIAGALRDDDAGSDSGSAYIFFRTGTTWSQQAKLTADDGAAGDEFGIDVGIEADTAIVGAYLDDLGGADAGSAYVFHRAGAAWSQQAKLTASDDAAGDQFGFSVAVEGDNAIVGALFDEDRGSQSGSAYVFVRDGATWSQQAKLIASDTAMFDLLGYSVGISGDYAVVTARGDGSSTGAAYIFIRSGTSWSEEAKLVPSDGTSGDMFGTSSSIEGNTAIIGARYHNGVGAAYVFVRSGTTWSQQAKLVASAGGGEFGIAVDLSLPRAVVGAYGGNGAAYMFNRVGTIWTEQATLTARNGQANDRFGISAEVDGDYAFVGAFWDDDNGAGAGSAYAFWFGYLSDGEVCTLDSECASVHCEDGFCCNEECSECGDCDVSGSEGTCASHADGTAGSPTCAPYLCDGLSTLCPSACAVDGDCAASFYCAGVACVAKKADGLLCSLSNECASEYCVDTVCCDSACIGDPNDCMACSLVAGATADGSCESLDGNACDDGVFCNGTDTCQLGACAVHVGDPCPGVDGDEDCVESCDENTGTCTANDPDGQACGDGLYCNGTETCLTGVCGDSSGDPCLDNVGDSDDDCSESCHEETSACSADDPNGSPCDDGVSCNAGDLCQAGACDWHALVCEGGGGTGGRGGGEGSASASTGSSSTTPTTDADSSCSFARVGHSHQRSDWGWFWVALVALTSRLRRRR